MPLVLTRQLLFACRALADWYSFLLLRAGATLLTPGERILYGLIVLVIVVLVSVGMSHALSFYVRKLSVLLSD